MAESAHLWPGGANIIPAGGVGINQGKRGFKYLCVYRRLAQVTESEIIRNIQKHTALNTTDAAVLFSFFTLRKLRKNETLMAQGDTPALFVLIKSGCLMTYHTDANRQVHIIQFGTDMWWTGDLSGFTQGKPSQYTVKAMTKAEVYAIDLPRFDALMRALPALERYFRIIFQNALVSHQKRIVLSFAATAREKYRAFQKQFPRMELIVPQKYIASYLGITPEFLSTIRHRKAKS
ncbi:MAG: Crp/Fnr family transcriptional regulator [Cyclobacteriaceae bacterium]|nr:Crp/Fnr family transcriptional regulator [Cyclobacteriaceae bacterium]